MGTIKFALKMLVKDAHKSFSFLVTEFFAIMTSFMFFNIIENEFLRDNTAATSGTSMQDISVPIATMLALIIIMFSCYMLFNANNLYLTHKTKDIAILEMSGSTFMSSTSYLFVQFIVMSLIAGPLGMLAGTGGALVANKYMYQYLSINSNSNFIPFNAYRDTLLLLGVVFFMMFMLDAGYIHRHDLQYLLSQEHSNEVDIAAMYRVHDIIYLIMAAGGLALIVTTPFESGQYLPPCFLGAVGVTGCINQVIPNLIDKLKGRLWIDRKIRLISFSNLAFSLRRSSMLILIHGLTTITMIAIIVTQRYNPREYVTGILAYMVVTLMIAVSIMYKYIAEAHMRKTFFFNLYKLGFTPHQIDRIVFLEVICYYVLLIISPLIYVIPLVVLFVMNDAATKLFASVMLSSAIIPSMIMGVVTYIAYKRIVFDKIKEGMHRE
ncbi:MAG: hypothetical protein J6P61_05425 [Erysipelotrichaceae bacterium]|nr:hypothetical protein [Erysipelotrichaceae bacterium]